jgi:hypothetical protein
MSSQQLAPSMRVYNRVNADISRKQGNIVTLCITAHNWQQLLKVAHEDNNFAPKRGTATCPILHTAFNSISGINVHLRGKNQ